MSDPTVTDSPPPVLDSARVLAYASVEDIPYRKWGFLYNGGQLIEKVPWLAICTNLGEDIGPMLFHCDAEWNVLGVSGEPTIDECKARAEKNYPGVNSRWIETNIDVERALEYYDEINEGLICLFCEKRPFEVSGMVGSRGRAICRECVEAFYLAFREPDSDPGSISSA
ncbi:MAG TPA: hypothetical protein VGI23_01940 [Steroidobacteraceae bacterium]